MRFRSLAESGTSCILAVLWNTLVSAIIAQSAGAQEVSRCALMAPKYQVKGSVAAFEITIDCSPTAVNAKPFSVGEEVLVGLTVYAGASVKEQLRGEANRRLLDAVPVVAMALKGATQSKTVTVAGGPKWIVLTDADVESYDFPAQVIRIEKGASRIAAKFQAELKYFEGKQYFLFAAWPKGDRKQCKRDDKYARSGCKREGYVIGDDSGVFPIATYPGMEINEMERQGEDWKAERWIVERFR
jgi:hypothetical protein